MGEEIGFCIPQSPILIYYMQSIYGKYIFENTDGGHIGFLSFKMLMAANFANSIVEMNSSHPKNPILIYYMHLCNNICGKYIFGNTDGGHI